MNTLSDPVLGLLIQVGGDHTLSAPYSKSDLETMLLRADLARYGRGGPNKQEILRSALLNAQRSAQGGDEQAHRGLLKFVLRFVEQRIRDPKDPPSWFDELREELLADGYQLSWVHEESSDPFGPDPVSYRLLPTDPTPVPLHAEISALQSEFADRGFNDALNHYNQAVDSFLHHKYESANSQLRTTLEDVVVRIATQSAGYVGGGQAGEGGRAISHLTVETHTLADDEGGMLLRGIWKMTHTRGAHPGRSHSDETRLRMQLITAVLRLLLNRFPMRP